MAESDIERLYGLPLEEFTTARDELARQLRRAGDRAAAEEIRKLRKPSVAAWALNQVQRRDAGAVGELIAAGDRLREAQERLLAAGERGGLREAAAQERTLVEQVAGAAERELAGAGHAVTAATQTRLFATLRAVATNLEARELLSRGALVRDYEPSDLGLGAFPAGVSAAREARGPGVAAARKAGRIEQQLERARTRRAELDRERRDADQEASSARREASRAAVALERAQAALARAEEALARAEAALARAEAALERASARAREAEERVSELEGALGELRA